MYSNVVKSVTSLNAPLSTETKCSKLYNQYYKDFLLSTEGQNLDQAPRCIQRDRKENSEPYPCGQTAPLYQSDANTPRYQALLENCELQEDHN